MSEQNRPILTPDGRREVARIVRVLDQAGLLTPRAPDPRDLEESLADWGEPVSVGAVLMALFEADHWRPDFRAEDYLEALAFHDSQTEQDADSLLAQVADLARLTAADLHIDLPLVDVPQAEGGMRTRIGLRLADQPLFLDYASHPKRLSTVLHAAVARALAAAGTTAARTDRARLAWLWVDQGVWLAVLRDGVSVEGLNAELGEESEPWTWVDEEAPIEAGAPPH